MSRNVENMLSCLMGKTNNLHMRKQRLCSAFVFAILIVQFLYFLTLKFPVSSHLQCLYRLVCVGPVRKSHLLVSHAVACLFVLWLNNPVNNLSVMLGCSHRLLDPIKEIMMVFLISMRRTTNQNFKHGGHLGHVTWTIYINFCSPFLRMLHMKFGFDWPSGFRGEEL